MLFQHGRLNVNQLIELMPLSRPAVSHHLKLMLQAESVLVLAEFAEMGIDLLEIFGGNYESPAMIQGVKESTRRREDYFLDYVCRKSPPSHRQRAVDRNRRFPKP